MKAEIQARLYTVTIIIFLFGNLSQLFGQKGFNLTTGVGIPELLNIGVRYQIDQFQIGTSVGIIPGTTYGGGRSLSISSDFYGHFAGVSKLSTRRPWYGRIGLDYIRDEGEYIIENYLYVNTRIGREFNISNKIGFQVGIGAFYEMSKKLTRKSPPPPRIGGLNFNLNSNFTVLPSIGIGLFYKI